MAGLEGWQYGVNFQQPRVLSLTIWSVWSDLTQHGNTICLSVDLSLFQGPNIQVLGPLLLINDRSLYPLHCSRFIQLVIQISYSNDLLQ